MGETLEQSDPGSGALRSARLTVDTTRERGVHCDTLLSLRHGEQPAGGVRLYGADGGRGVRPDSPVTPFHSGDDHVPVRVAAVVGAVPPAFDVDPVRVGPTEEALECTVQLRPGCRHLLSVAHSDPATFLGLLDRS